MAGEWPTARIEEVAERVAMGPFGSSIKVETFVPEGVPVISGQHLHGWRVDGSAGFNFIAPEHAEKLRNANVRRGDVIFTHAGNIGQVSYVPRNSAYDRYVISQRQFYLRPDLNKTLPEYLVAYFRSPEGQHKLLANTSQVGVPSIAQPVTYLRSIEIPLPPLPEQHAIAHILGTLDDKIELNRKQNETLEAMARALFKAWFVDFEPVRAKIEGRWQRGQSLPGLPARLYDLFPDRLVESELGEIPEGWKVTSLSEYSSLNPESWTKRTRPKQIRYVDLSNTKWGRVESVTNYEGDDAPSRAQRVLRPLDTIVGTVRPGNGSYALISDEGLTGSTGFAVLRPLRRECTEFVYFAATSRENIERLSNLADGGAYPAVRPEIVSATHVPRVGQELINRFSQQVSPMIAGIAGNDRESRTLAALRDALLPKLISGEIRVKDAEQFLRERVL
jgi:type I restriction enzyme S subunit